MVVERCLYLLVVDATLVSPTTLHQRVSKWVESVQANAPKALLLPVLTHCSHMGEQQLRDVCKVVEQELQLMLGAGSSSAGSGGSEVQCLLPLVWTDASSYSGYREPMSNAVCLMSQLKHAVCQLPHLKDPVPVAYLALEGCLRRQEWPRGQWVQRVGGLREWASKQPQLKPFNLTQIPGMLEAALQCLHYRGTILHYHSTPSLQDFVLLHPQVHPSPPASPSPAPPLKPPPAPFSHALAGAGQCLQLGNTA